MKSSALWTLSFVLMFAAGAYQRRTGPSYPERGELASPGGQVAYRLPRSHSTSEGVLVQVPAAAPSGVLQWRRYPTSEPFRPIPLEARGDTLQARIPAQPPAGKVEYWLELDGEAGLLRVPERDTVILRYRGDVSAAVLIPHVLLMFLSMMIALRAALGALAGRTEPRLPWIALAGFTVGGLIFGPIVQRHAFGAYWTGIPFGWDLTDNKTLVMWLAWLAVCLVPPSRAAWRRPVIIAAAVITLVVYLIPHSMRGSEHRYDQLSAAAGIAGSSAAAAEATSPAP